MYNVMNISHTKIIPNSSTNLIIYISHVFSCLEKYDYHTIMYDCTASPKCYFLIF